MSFYKEKAIVLYAPLGNADIAVPLHPESRYNEILRCKSLKTQTEKYQVWKLLEFAVKNYTSLEFANLQFTKTDNNKWVCPQLYFSLSHSDGIVCVAISDEPIGVDAESVRTVRRELDTRILTDRERSSMKDAAADEYERYLLEAWVKKESIFKMGDGTALMPNRIEADEHPTALKRVTLAAREYLISVCHTRAYEIEFKYVEEI